MNEYVYFSRKEITGFQTPALGRQVCLCNKLLPLSLIKRPRLCNSNVILVTKGVQYV